MEPLIGADGTPAGAGLGAGAPAKADLIKDSDTANFGSRDNTDDTASNAAFGRNTNAIGEISDCVV